MTRSVCAQLLRYLCIALLVAGRWAQSIASSTVVDSAVGATDAAVLGRRVFVVTHAGVVHVLDATASGQLTLVGELRDNSGEGGASVLHGATGIAAADSALTGGTWLWVTVGSASTLVTLHQSSTGALDVASVVTSPQLHGAAGVTVRDGIALVAAVATDQVVSVDVRDPEKPALVAALRLSGVDHVHFPEDGLVRVASGSARRMTLLSVSARGGLAKFGSVKDVRLGAAGSSRARSCSPPSAPDFSVVLSDVGGTTLALVNVTDRGAPAVLQGLSAAGTAQPGAPSQQFMDSSSAWPMGYASLLGASALACVNGSAYVAVPSDGDGAATGHVSSISVATFDAVQDVLTHEALLGVGVLVPAPWGLVAVAPQTGMITSLRL
jgi:hypothetical protein